MTTIRSGHTQPTAPGWNTSDAREQLAIQAAVERAGGVQGCPNCGSPGEPNLIDVTTFRNPEFIVVGWHCPAKCWRTDPQGYIDAVERNT